MTITLSELIESQPDFVDVPLPGTGKAFRLHRLPLHVFLKLRPQLEQMQEMTEVGDDGSIEFDDVAEQVAESIAPVLAKSLGGDFDSPKGIDYLARRIDLVQLLFPKLADLHFGLKGDNDVSLETSVKND